MAKRLFNMRVRPPRSTILISKHASESDLLLAFDFLSQTWGGRFGQIIPVNKAECDPLTEFRLGRSRPDFVYGIRLDDENWRRRVLDACQPRKYVPLSPDFLKNPPIPDRDLNIPAAYALEHFIANRHPDISARRFFWLVSATKDSVWSVYCAAMYGVHFLNLPTSYYDHFQQLEEDTIEGFFRIAQQFASQCLFSWLDLTALALHPGTDWQVLPPTIVLVGDLIADLSLFWNLRAATDSSTPVWIIPLPMNQVNDPKVRDRLKQWLITFSQYGKRPNYCVVTSQSVDEQDCQSFAEVLQQSLAGTNFEFVDYEPPLNRIPDTLPFEYMTTQNVDVKGRHVSFQPPQLKAFKPHSSSTGDIVNCCG
jgi:hypothetical protein